MKRKLLRFYYKYFYSISGCLFNHYMHGKFRVRYKDGAISQPFDYTTACDYRDMFGGEVIDNF